MCSIGVVDMSRLINASTLEESVYFSADEEMDDSLLDDSLFDRWNNLDLADEENPARTEITSVSNSPAGPQTADIASLTEGIGLPDLYSDDDGDVCMDDSFVERETSCAIDLDSGPTILNGAGDEFDPEVPKEYNSDRC
jgi:hypothetical protein